MVYGVGRRKLPARAERAGFENYVKASGERQSRIGTPGLIVVLTEIVFM